MKQSSVKNENLFKNGRELHKAEILVNILNNIFLRLLPALYSLFYCDNSQFKILRGIIAFFFGTFYAIAIWYLTIFRIEELSNSAKILVLFFKITVISSGMASNFKFRCIMALGILRFVFKSAKVILISYIIVGILNGPIRNIYSNLSELGESIVCQHRQLTNLTNMQKENLNVNKDLIKKVLSGYKEMETQKKEISGFIDGLNSELEGQVQSKNCSETSKLDRNTSKDSFYYEKNLNRCLEIFKSGETKCMDNMKIVSKEYFKKASQSKFCQDDCKDDVNINESCSFESLDLNSKILFF